ncbi:MAG TPA: hypothetical protein VNO75_02480 [Gemmatimonadaceae bacterium]|nr:hypothetical protein [Gemmatimonadaceae bacterium]
MRLISIVFVILAASAEVLHAQRRIPRPLVGEPATWVTAGAGFFTANGVNDGATESTWDFGSATNFQYRASLERTIGDRSSIGLIGTYVRVPFTYVSNATLPSGEEAHLDMMTLSLGFHIGGGPGLHQVIEGNAGAVRYSNLKRDSDGAALAPTGGNVDPIFSFGYGFGYGFGQTTQINLVQDIGIALHEKTGLANGVRNTNSVRTLRFTARFGFGTRARR